MRRAALTLGAAVGVFGVSFGVVARGAGVSTPMACAMSLLVFTGASQFAAVGVVASGGSGLAALGSALLLGVRHIGYGLALHRRFPRSRWSRLAAAQLVIDESTVMAVAQPDDRAARRAFWLTGASVFVCWNIGTLLGALFGSVLGDPDALGLDAVFPAAFLALLVPLLDGRGRRAAATGGALIALVLVSLAAAGVPVIAASLAALPAAILGRRGARS